jgi:hypothetical protein
MLASAPPKLTVSGTNIFARVADGTQWLVYAMALDTPGDVAMVLPLPVRERSETALEFIDLSGCADLFVHLAQLFVPPAPVAASYALSRGGAVQEKTLVVHQVGSFEASYVPSLADMSRLDKRFRIPDEVWAQRPAYGDYGFAVFKLKKGKRTIHPMAMRFPTAEPQSLFFPTVHVHDGELHPTADFDHWLYFQAPNAPATATEALYPVAMHVPLAATKGIVDGMQRTFRQRVTGTLANDDTRIALG